MVLEQWQKNSKNLQATAIYYIKYINEESEDKALKELINKKEVAKVTAIEERGVLQWNTASEMRKQPRWLLCTGEKKKLHEKEDIPKTTTTTGYICSKVIW